MALPLVSADTWRAIKLASISGVSDAKLAERFGVTTNAISSRRFDDAEWKAVKPRLLSPPPIQQSKRPPSKAEELEALKTDSLAEIGEQNSLLLARFTSQAIKTSLETGLVNPPEGWAELKTASEILRKATGQDRDQAAVSVNLFSGGCSFDDVSPTFDVVVETQEASEADFC